VPRMRSLVVPGVVVVTAASVAAAEPSAPAPRGSIVIASTRDPGLHDELWSLELRTGRRVNLSRSPAGDREPAVSPDGQTVAFVSDRGGAEALYAVRADGSGLRRLAGPFPESAPRRTQVRGPAWSPDGRQLAFMVTSAGDVFTAEARVVSREGGTTRSIASGSVDAVRWSPDGRRLAVTSFGPKGSSTSVHDVRGRRLWRVVGRLADWSARGDLALLNAPEQSLAVVGEDGRVRWRTVGGQALWSPDGRFLAVAEPDSIRVHDDRGRVRLRPRAGLGYVSAWLADGRALIVSDGEGRFLRLGLDGGTSSVPAALASGRVGPKGAVAYTSATSIVVRRGAAERRYPSPWRFSGLCAAGRVPGGVAWAGADRLVYVTGGGGQHEGDLWVVTDGSIRRLPGGAGVWRGAPAWSPGGGSIVYEQGFALRHGGGCAGPHTPHLRVADASGANVRVLTPPEGNFDRNPRWSPDGRRIAFERSSAGDETVFGIVVVDVATRAERRLTTGFHTRPSWTADGAGVVYEDSGQLRRVELATAVVTSLGSGEDAEAAPAGDLVAFLRGGALWTVRNDGTDARRLATVRRTPSTPPTTSSRAPRWSPDGRRLAVPDARGVLVVSPQEQQTKLIPARGAGDVAWSRDGRTISFTGVVGRYSRGIFNTAYVSRTELYTVPAGGGKPRRRTRDLANVVGAAAWRP
jgi:Tol biopolymer transport system component